MTAPILLLILLCLVAALVGAYVLWPLLRRNAAPGAAGADAAAVSRAVLRERRRELEASLSHLPEDSPERRAALAEFAAQAESELAGDAARGAAPAAVAARRPWAALAIAVLLGVPTFALYLLAGAPQAASPEMRAREPANLDELVADLNARLKTDPKALDGWRLLGRAELARGRPDAAREAFERALALAPDDAQARVDLADALAQSQGAVLEGRPIELIREALKLDARNPKALALAGAYEVSRRDYAAAIGLWTRLLEVLPADSEQAKQVAGFVADLKAGRPPQVGPRDAAPQAAAPQAAPGDATPPAAAGAGAAPAMAGGPGALRGRIELERRLEGRPRPDDTLFVVARTIDDTGRPVGPPVAVLRARAGDLPLEFTLDDRMAMSPAARLSAIAPGTQVVVLARVSRSGEASAKPGDLQGASAPVRAGASDLRVLIDTVVD